ncbi:hypothetical protein ACH4VX_18220 [Streptomyces sp. NPDC020731]|uniref:hypothetical protein n=1 Tax=Streptomyces sp. NPDC020731 TaxID=3365085 RepID=UPI0037AAF6C9
MTEHRPAREVTVVTPWLRAVGTTVVLVAGAAVMPYGPVVAPSGTGVAYGVGAVPSSPSPSSPSPSPSSSPSSSPGSSPSGEPSRAGNRPGEGRDRPRRHETTGRESRERERGDRDGTDGGGAGAAPRKPGHHAGRASEPPDAAGMPRPGDDGAVSRAPGGGGTVPRAPASQAAVPVPSATSRAAEPNTVAATEPVLRILPLGSGLMLIGLGFGLAFVALRMRQGRGAS